jgi:hypothetical protein
MPANLPPEYIEAELRFRAAKSPQEKLEILRELMALVPKHKGTEKLRVELKRKWAKLQEEIQQQQKKQKGSRGAGYDHIEREGAGQITLVGLPNCGKSSLLAAVTNAKPEIAEYPFSTFRPTVGMMPFEDIQFQLIDLPPLSEFTEPWVYSLIRQCDLVALLIDLSSETPAEDLFAALGWLEQARIRLVHHQAREREGPATVKPALGHRHQERPSQRGRAPSRAALSDRLSVFAWWPSPRSLPRGWGSWGARSLRGSTSCASTRRSPASPSRKISPMSCPPGAPSPTSPVPSTKN